MCTRVPRDGAAASVRDGAREAGREPRVDGASDVCSLRSADTVPESGAEKPPRIDLAVRSSDSGVLRDI